MAFVLENMVHLGMVMHEQVTGTTSVFIEEQNMIPC